MCFGCELKENQSNRLLSHEWTKSELWMERAAGVFRLHLVDGTHHSTRDIYFCPFCGRNLKGGGGDEC